MSALALSFASPLLLFGLLALPLIWWLLKLTPPNPREEVFPPTRILLELDKKEETPAKSPWWLTLLRLLMAALVVLALAEPIWNAQDQELSGDGPLLVVLDDTWASASDWDARKSSAKALLEKAESEKRPVALTLVSEEGKAELNPALSKTQKAKLAASQPLPIKPNLAALAARLESPQTTRFSTIAWLSNGINLPGLDAFLQAVSKSDTTELMYYAPEIQGNVVLSSVANSPDALTATVERAGRSGTANHSVTAFDLQGRSISSAEFQFENEKQTAEAKFVLPVELRNEVVRIAVDDQRQAGAVQLLDERFRRRRVGLISGSKADQAQPLLSPLYFISRALSPFSEIREARSASIAEAVPQLIDEKVSMLVLADIGTLPQETSVRLEKWVENGGMLVRFAGPRLAAAEDDTLVPAELRRGGRSLGGTLTWGTPQPLTSFEETSPFKGIPVPGDVTVSRQVLAEPSIDLADKTWASLADGTPLVTASERGKGWIVLFHVTADSAWSNLPLSGAFVDMLRRIVAVSNGAIAADQVRSQTGTKVAGTTANADAITMPPLRVMNGFGRLGPPNSNTRPLKLSLETPPTPSIENPPGMYGTSDAFVALNLFQQPAQLELIDTNQLPKNHVEYHYSASQSVTLKPWLIGAVLLLLAIDCFAVLWMAGAMSRISKRAIAIIAIGLLSVPVGPDVYAQDADANFEFSLRTRLAYVKTGDEQLDELSRKGLIGLTQFISSRTSLEPGAPVAVDIASDELAFFPLLYWPISSRAAIPDEKAMARVDAFMKKGGSILFDTRDQFSGGFGNSNVSSETETLREILLALDIPPLEPVPENHVLTRAFYLLDVFPGRYLDGKLWVETSEANDEDVDRPARQGDGVSSILITANDMAGAWAIEANGAPSLPVVPPNPTQRIYAYRTGVNIVMYTLTGNYKSDQVHIPALLERLGQ